MRVSSFQSLGVRTVSVVEADAPPGALAEMPKQSHCSGVLIRHMSQCLCLPNVLPVKLVCNGKYSARWLKYGLVPRQARCRF